MTRGQWIAVILLVFLVIIAIVIGIILWMRRRTAVVIETVPNNAGGVNAVVAPIVTGAANKVNNVRKVKQPTSTGATYREILGRKGNA